MRKIKLIVSDFHLGFGRVMNDGTVNDLEDFVSDQAFIDLLEHYRTGPYLHAEAELVLNGDIFECLATVDPADPQPDLITVNKSLEKMERIVAGHAEMFQALRTFSDDGRRRITLVVGNHDQDLLWEEVQQRLRAHIHESLHIVTDFYEFDGVYVEHGHQHEFSNRFDEKRPFVAGDLSEPVLHLPWGSDMFINSLLPYKRMRPYANRVRPLRLALQWSLWHDFFTLVRLLWYFIVAVVAARFRRQRQRRITFLHTLRVLFGNRSNPTLEDAATRLLKQRDIHTVIFGHTHLPIWRQVLPGKTYVNSGAWVPTTNLHISALGHNLMQTFAYVEYEGGHPRARLKRWHGRHMVEEDVVV